MAPSLATYTLPPELNEGDYETYKKEIELWKLMKICEPTEQGVVVARGLTGRAKVAALELTVEQIGSKEGLALILAKLDKLYLPEENLRICSLLEKFEMFKRSPSMTMSNFILDFENLHSKLKAKGCTYPDGALAYRLMKAANMSNEHEKMVRATVSTGDWSYQAVTEQLNKIFNDISAIIPTTNVKYENPVKVEEPFYSQTFPQSPQECFLTNNYEEQDV